MDYTQYALLLKAFAHEKRIRILHLLYYRGEVAEQELDQITGHKTKRQLDYLHGYDLIVAREEGQIVFYTIKEEYKPLSEAILSRLTEDRTLQEDLKKYDQLLYQGKAEKLLGKTLSHQ
jgi:hypothetical protein